MQCTVFWWIRGLADAKSLIVDSYSLTKYPAQSTKCLYSSTKCRFSSTGRFAVFGPSFSFFPLIIKEKEKIKASNQYEVWRNAMELLKSLFKQTAELLSASADLGEIYFVDLGTLEFEKYLSLKNRGSAKKTWFFRLDFRSGPHAARYLFFFGSPSLSLIHI